MDANAHGYTRRGEELLVHSVVLKADVRERGMGGGHTNLGRRSISKKKGEDGEMSFQSALYLKR